MDITEVRIKLMEDSDDRLQAFCSITIDDCFVIRDLKIIEGSSGPFVAMPSRKLTSHCPQCGTQESSAQPLLQPVWRAAERGPHGAGPGWACQAVRGYRPPDQLAVPRDDPEARD